ncbi:hypothetical protein KR093_001313 [Drosophila rubida]|uniref:TATA box-binding protein-like 1 n=1 Tax=Drosophila rubida TaxID=30044 RepID=A0AAD4K5Y8_9MUSC|nr:hypothetical protein KR093_001313 [Drosophila rubida]
MSFEVNDSLAVAEQVAEPVVQSNAELDIVINNVVCSFSVKCHLNLHDIALHGINVEYRRENSMLTMRLRRPYTTASIWSSGRITCTGATSEQDAKIAARRYARRLQKLGFPVGFHNFRIYNVLGTCTMPWAIRIVQFSERHRSNASYEPELHPGVTYRMTDPTATLKIFSTGSITVTAQNVATVDLAIQRIYDLVYEFRNENNRKDLDEAQMKERLSKTPRQPTLGAPRTASTTWRPKPQVHSYMKFLETLPQTKEPLTNTTNTVTTSSSYNASENIFSNARRRATERWVTKLQEKQSRYADPSAFARPAYLPRPRGVFKTAKGAILSTNRQLNLNKPTGLAGNRQVDSSNLPRPSGQPRSIGVLPPPVRTTVPVAVTAVTTYTAPQVTAAPVAPATVTPSPLATSGNIQLVDPSDFEVDDLIEEVDDDDMDWQI